ncbi:MAG: 4Fe-4S binding protein [Planctomycetota bacterium]
MSATDLPSAEGHAIGCGTQSAPAKPRSTRGKWRALVLLAVHAAIAARVAHWLSAGRTVTPLEPSEAAVALASKVVDAGILFFALTILSTLILGRFFCGWACHLVALQDGAAWLLGKLGVRPRLVRSRILAFVPFVGVALMFGWPFVARALVGESGGEWRMELTTDDFWGRFPGPVIAVLTFLTCGFAAVWLLGAKGFCTYACPYGAVYGIADRFARGRVRVDPDACESCGHCTAVCTSNVAVHREVALYQQVVDPGCMKCLDCVSACPKDALRFGFGSLPPKQPVGGGAKPRRVYDFSVGEEWVLGGVFVLAFVSWFRSHSLVPLLLALTLAVFVALFAVLLGRLIRSSDLRFQRVTLKREGQLTPRGALAGLACLALLGLTGHSGVVQANEIQATLALSRAVEASGGERTEALESARSALESVATLGLVRRKGLSNQLGQVLAELGDDEAALAQLEAAIAESPDAIAPRRKRAEVLERAERWPELATALLDLVEREPLTSARAYALASSGVIQRIASDAPDSDDFRLLAIHLQLSLGDLETARTNLEAAADRNPFDPRVERLWERYDEFSDG